MTRTKCKSHGSHTPKMRTPIALAILALTAVPAHALSIVWKGTISSDWMTATNWNPASIPGAGDDVTIGSGTPVLNADTTIHALTFSSGTLGGTGTLNTSSLSWSGNATKMLGTGVTNANGPATLTNAGTTYLYLGDGRVLNLYGDTSFQAYALNLYNTSGGTLNNAAGATFTSSYAGINFINITAGKPGAFNNAGSFVQDSGSGHTTTVNAAFNNTGSVTVKSGTLALAGSGTHSGSFSTLAGATLNLSGNQTFDSSVTVANAGSLRVSGGAIDLGDNYSGTGDLLVTGGTLNLNGQANATALTINGTGTANVNGTVNATTLTLAAGTLGGTGTLNTSSLSWSGNATKMLGTGVTNANGPATLTNAGTTYLYLGDGRVLNLYGDTSFQAYALNLYNTSGGTLNNAAGATFTSSYAGNNFINITAGKPGAFNNAGSFVQDPGSGRTTTVNAAFNNTGSVTVKSGTLALAGSGTHSGSFSTLAGATLNLSGNQTFDSSVTVANAGSLQVSGGMIDLGGNYSGTGDLLVTGGTLNLNGQANATALTINGTGTANVNGTVNATTLTLAAGTLGGTGTLNTSSLSWSGSATKMLGTGVTNANGPATLTNAGTTYLYLGDGRVLNLYGDTSFQAYALNLYNTSGGTLNNAAGATFTSSYAGNNFINITAGKPGAFNNAGSFVQDPGSGHTTTVNAAFNNTGSVTVKSGTLALTNATQQSGSTLTGGTWAVADNATLQMPSNILTNQGSVTLSGPSSVFARIDTLNNNQGTFSIQDGRTFTTAGAFANSGTVDTGAGSTMTFSGALTNGGTVLASGTVNASAPISGSGFLQISSGGQLNLGAAGLTGTLILNGSTTNALNLGANNLTISTDYQNANFGTGDSFDRRANVAGTGSILSSNAAAAVQQGLSGDIVGGATNGNATLDFGNGHVADVFSKNFRVTNAAGGPSLRGAIQTGANGGHITDLRLSGSGVTAGSFGAIAAGAISPNFEVTFAPNVSGALSGQAVAVVNNFGNTNSQLLAISGAAFAYAAPSTAAPNQVSFANARVGDLRSQPLTITNMAANDGFSEKLNAIIASNAPGVITASGSIGLLAPQSTDGSSLEVGIDTGSAGHKSGSATISFASDGSGTSGLGVTPLPSQTVTASGDVYRLASASSLNPVIFANARVGDTRSRTLTITNIAASDGFSEKLNASVATSDSGIIASGSFMQLAAQATDNSKLVVGIDTGSAGHKSGSASITLASDGTGSSGFSPLALASQNVIVSGNVYTPAALQVNTPTVDFGIVHKGDPFMARNVSITNAAPVSALNDQLHASLSGVSGPFTANGSTPLAGVAAQASDSSSLTVSLDTANAGQFNSKATLSALSRGPGMADLALAPASVSVLAQVNNFAEVSLQKKAGDGTFSQSGNLFTLDFGTFVIGSTGKQSSLSVLNTASGFADLVRGSFAIGGVASPFSLSGFNNFDNLAAGSRLDGLQVLLSGSTIGTFENSIVLSSTGFNDSGYQGALADRTLVLRVTVAAVPEPGTYGMMLSGLLVVMFSVRRRTASQAA